MTNKVNISTERDMPRPALRAVSAASSEVWCVESSASYCTFTNVICTTITELPSWDVCNNRAEEEENDLLPSR